METAASMDSMDMLSDIHGPFVLYIVGLFSLRKFEVGTLVILNILLVGPFSDLHPD